VEATAADGRREIVHLPREESIAVAVVAPVAPRLEERIGSEEIATLRLDLVVGNVAQPGEGRVE